MSPSGTKLVFVFASVRDPLKACILVCIIFCILLADAKNEHR